MTELISAMAIPGGAAFITAGGTALAVAAFILISEPGFGRYRLGTTRPPRPTRHSRGEPTARRPSDLEPLDTPDRPDALHWPAEPGRPGSLGAGDRSGQVACAALQPGAHLLTTITYWILPRDLPAGRSSIPHGPFRAPETQAPRPDVALASAVLAPAEPLTRFGPYLLITLIAAGGMGQVWHAVDTRSGRAVALKRLHPLAAHDLIARERFRREAALLARVDAAHVIPVYETGDVEEELYVAMHLAADTLAALLDEHPDGLHPRRVARIIDQIAAAVEAVHALGFAHRDIKLANVVLDTRPAHTTGPTGPNADAEDMHCYLIDVGIAAPLGSDAAGTVQERLTAAWAMLGTPAYMAPELFDSRPAGVATDVYALGVLLHQLLTGRTPFHGPGLAEMAGQHLITSPPAPSTYRLELGRYDTVLATALAKNPDDRYPTPTALAAAFTAALTTAAPAAPEPGRTDRPEPGAGNHPAGGRSSGGHHPRPQHPVPPSRETAA